MTTAFAPTSRPAPRRADDTVAAVDTDRADRGGRGPRFGWPRLIVATVARSVLALVCSLAMWGVLPAVIGWQSTTVMTGSMQPRILIGDIAVAKPTDPAELRQGQLLLFPDPDHPDRLRLHRFVAADDAGLIITRGDANDADDSTHVVPESVEGVAVLRIPYVGLPLVWWHDGRHLPVVLTGLALVGLLALAGLDRGVRREDDTDTTDSTIQGGGGGDAGPITDAELAALLGPVVVPDGSRWSPRPGGLVTELVAGPSRRVAAVLAVSAVALLAFSLLAASPAWAAFSAKTTASATLGAARYYSCDSAPAADAPSLYWKLDETSGAANSTAADATGNGRPGQYIGGFTNATAACGRGSAITLNGSSQYLTTSSTTAVAGPNTFSVEAWFKTGRGGMIANFGNARTGGSGQHDRKIYVSDAGRVYFGVYPGTVKTVASGTGYTDNRWHHVVATLSGNGMRLYLDGALVASDSTVTTAESFSGFWRFGYDTPGGWTDAPANGFLAGSLDNVAVYPTALTATQVADHYASR